MNVHNSINVKSRFVSELQEVVLVELKLMVVCNYSTICWLSFAECGLVWCNDSLALVKADSMTNFLSYKLTKCSGCLPSFL